MKTLFTIVFVITVLLTSVAHGEKKVCESRYLDYQSRYDIVEILAQLGGGVIKDSQLITDLFDKQTNDEELRRMLVGYMFSVYRTFRMDIDGEECDCSFRTFFDVCKHITRYVLDYRTDGSIKYSYSFTYNSIRVDRETYFANDRLIFTTRLYGQMSETIERGVTVHLVYAELVLDAKQINGTTIRSVLTAKTIINSGCIKERIAANRVVPDMMGDLICAELYRLHDMAIKVAATGRGDAASVVTHAFIKKLGTNGLK